MAKERKLVEAVEADAALQLQMKHEREIGSLKRKLASNEQKCKILQGDLEAAECRVDFIRSLADPKPFPIARKPTKPHGTATAILVLSDWHVEETVDPSTVNGFNEFNLEVASRRITRTFEKAVTLIEAERAMSNIKDLVVAVLGDMITGYIHEELQEMNSLSPSEATLFVEDHLVSGIEFLRKHSGCKSITVPTAFGNHGRTTPKMRIATAYKNSYEWLMYKHLEKSYRNDPMVKWKVENGYHNWLDIQGHPCRMHHGHAFRYMGGVQGPGVPIRRKIAEWDKKRKAWQDWFGHLHGFDVGDKYVTNGSLIGYGPYGELSCGGDCLATQTLIIVDRDQPIPVAVKPIFCEPWKVAA